MLLSLVLDDSRKTSRMIYKEKDLETIPERRISNYNVKHNQVEEFVIVKEEKHESLGTFKRLYHFLMESVEYLHPDIYGWRIKFRRLFLTIGTLAFTHTTINTAIVAAQYSSKDEIQKILDYTKTNLTWPDSGSALDDVFELYNSVTKTQSYLMVTACILFWIGLIIDFISHHSANHKIMLYSASRIANFFGSLIGFASVIVVGLPDYLEASKLDTICLSCSLNFDKTILLVAEFSIGMIAASVKIILYF